MYFRQYILFKYKNILQFMKIECKIKIHTDLMEKQNDCKISKNRFDPLLEYFIYVSNIS